MLDIPTLLWDSLVDARPTRHPHLIPSVALIEVMLKHTFGTAGVHLIAKLWVSCGHPQHDVRLLTAGIDLDTALEGGAFTVGVHDGADETHGSRVVFEVQRDGCTKDLLLRTLPWTQPTGLDVLEAHRAVNPSQRQPLQEGVATSPEEVLVGRTSIVSTVTHWFSKS